MVDVKRRENEAWLFTSLVIKEMVWKFFVPLVLSFAVAASREVDAGVSSKYLF